MNWTSNLYSNRRAEQAQSDLLLQQREHKETHISNVMKL